MDTSIKLLTKLYERGVNMSMEFTVSLAKIIKEIALEPFYMPTPAEDIQISSMVILTSLTKSELLF